jgi:hypothetical protein
MELGNLTKTVTGIAAGNGTRQSYQTFKMNMTVLPKVHLHSN